MNRKQFLQNAGGLVAFGAASPACCAQAAPAEGTPCDKKYAFAQTWAKRMMDILDSELDEKTRVRLMETMGRTCYRGAHPGKPAEKPGPETIDKVIAAMKKYGGDDMARRDGDVIHFQYVRNPAGLRVADGWCLCPVVEKGPPDLSGTYCHCSVGYVAEMFSRYSDVPVKVELVESLKRGGKTCRFRITLVRA